MIYQSCHRHCLYNLENSQVFNPNINFYTIRLNATRRTFKSPSFRFFWLGTKMRLRTEDTLNVGLSSIEGTTDCIGRSAPRAGIPYFSDPSEKRRWALERMAGAFRVVARKGYTEGTAGHISVRDPVYPESFWINPYELSFLLRWS